MSNSRWWSGVALVCAALAAGPLAAQEGRIQGRLTGPDGDGLSGVRVVVDETGDLTLTDFHGGFGLALPKGTYTLSLSAGDYRDSVPGVEVPYDGTVELDRTLDWDLTVAGATTVFSAAAGAEQVGRAPVPVNVLGEGEIELRAAHGQLAKLVEFGPGVDLAQSSLYDFALATQGLNDPLSRRLEVRLDGRDPSEIFFAGQEWAALSAGLSELTHAELVRGAAALHAAPGGVLNLVTRRPHESRGGSIGLAGGELGAFNGDARWATPLGGGWHLKLLASSRTGEDFSLSRVGAAEYSTPCAVAGQRDCLAQERVPLVPGDVEVTAGSARLDRVFKQGGLLSFEGGVTDLSGPVLQTQLGRLQVVEADWRWARGAFEAEHWRIIGAYKRREAEEQRWLATGDNLPLEEESFEFGAQTFWSISKGKQRLMAGISHTDDRIDSNDLGGPRRPLRLNPVNRQTLLFEPLRADADALYGQLDWRFGDLTLLAGVRWDDSQLHEPQTSPRLALVYSPAAQHTFRLSFDQSFDVPDYAEYFLQADIGDAFNFAALERLCALDAVFCGFDVDFIPGEDPALDTTPDTRVLALGNRGLRLPEVQTLSAGYGGRVGDRVFFQVDYYVSEHTDVVSNLVPQVGTSLGLVHPAFPFWQPPRGLSIAKRDEILLRLAEGLGPLFPFLSNNIDGTPIVALSTFTNLGDVDTQGIDLSLRWRLGASWTIDAGYSWFDFDIRRAPTDLADHLLPNAPEGRAGLTVAFASGRWQAVTGVRWVDDFRWAYGPFVGAVDAYSTVDLAANVAVGGGVSLGVNVANLLDEEHHEAFGGDLIGRRALGQIRFDW